MLTHNPPHRIPLAAAAEVAARLPGTRWEGAGYRTRGYCHGSGDKPTSASLVFSDPPRPGEQSLHVHCFKCNPGTPAERDAIRHALQKATGLQLCNCRACWEARRAGRPPDGATTRPAAPKQPAPRRRAKSDTAAYAGELWAAAQPSTSGPAEQHPVGRWLAARTPRSAGPPAGRCPKQSAGLPADTAFSPADNRTARPSALWSWHCARCPTLSALPARCIWSPSTPRGAKRTTGRQTSAAISTPTARTPPPMACSGSNGQQANTPAICTSSKASQTDWRCSQPCRMIRS